MLVILGVSLWWVKSKSSNTADRIAREKAVAQIEGPSSSENAPASKADLAAAAAKANNPAAFGMTWGQLADDKLPPDAVQMSCHGQPRDSMTQAHKDSCNPYAGDTSCRIVLPILCIEKTRSGVSDAAVDGTAPDKIASTQGVAGFVLGSLEGANARCEKELGTGWRMAEHHDGGGFSVIAKRGTPLDTHLRHWVHISNQPGNCWDSK